MTEEFKTKLLKYVTGNLSKEDVVNVPQYSAVKKVTNNIWEYIRNSFTEQITRINVIEIIQAKNSTGQNMDSLIFLGNALDSNNTFHGFILLLDNNFNPIQLISSYSSGADINIILTGNVGDDGELFIIEEVVSAGGNRRRFVMLNNVALKSAVSNTYQAVLSKAYDLVSPIKDAYTYNGIIKSPGSSKYLISSTYSSSSLGYIPLITQLTVNVGSENEWKNWQTTTNLGNWTYGDTWAQWSNDDNIMFKLNGYFTLNNVVRYTEINNSGDNLTTVQAVMPISDISSFYFKILSNVYSYCALVSSTSSNDNYDIYRYNSTYNRLDRIYRKETVLAGDFDQLAGFGLFVESTNMLYYIVYPADESANEFNVEVGRVVQEKVYPHDLTTITIDDTSTYLLFYVSSQFNLFRLSVQIGDNAYTTSQIYNQFNYNGLDYENVNSLKPKYANLYSGNDVIFSRNLTNVTASGNTTYSSVEIPNTMLNDINISNQVLVSDTNSELINNSRNLTKNVYETLNINFYDFLNIANENTSKSISNPVAAAKLNNSISVTNDFDNTKATKIKINFADGTSLINTLDPATQIKITGLSAIYSFVVNVTKEINTIEIISNDEQTVYQQINNLTLEIGKSYRINQEVIIL